MDRVSNPPPRHDGFKTFLTHGCTEEHISLVQVKVQNKLTLLIFFFFLPSVRIVPQDLFTDQHAVLFAVTVFRLE